MTTSTATTLAQLDLIAGHWTDLHPLRTARPHDAWPPASRDAIFIEQPRYNKSVPGPVLPAGVPPQPHGTRFAYQCREIRPALRQEWFLWRLLLQDGIETEREALRRIILLQLRARLADQRRGEAGPPM
ncbi:hypothetical protein ACFYNW_01585 [Streptomyces virginiae]|uniref:hypothetical protein n=1 Tax=Streptomyces virginiae TaxID=1961 RepID=UPI0036E705B9